MAKGKDKKVTDEVETADVSRRSNRNRELRDNGRLVAKYILDNPKGIPEEVLEAAKRVMPMRAAPGEGLRPRADNIKFFQELFKTKKTITEAELYERFNLTRPAMGVKRASALKQAKTPADRIWVGFDKAKGIYKLLGTGAKAPEGYEGPVPATKE